MKKGTKKAASAKPPRVVKKKSESAMPKLIYANASTISLGGVSMFDAGNQINSTTVSNFNSEPEVVARAVNRLRDAGFQVLQATPASINIAGTQETYERAFNTRLVAEERRALESDCGRATRSGAGGNKHRMKRCITGTLVR